MFMGWCKALYTQKPCKTSTDLVYRIQKFYRYKLTVEKCQKFIDHIKNSKSFKSNSFKINYLSIHFVKGVADHYR